MLGTIVVLDPDRRPPSVRSVLRRASVAALGLILGRDTRSTTGLRSTSDDGPKHRSVAPTHQNFGQDQGQGRQDDNDVGADTAVRCVRRWLSWRRTGRRAQAVRHRSPCGTRPRASLLFARTREGPVRVPSRTSRPPGTSAIGSNGSGRRTAAAKGGIRTTSLVDVAARLLPPGALTRAVASEASHRSHSHRGFSRALDAS